MMLAGPGLAQERPQFRAMVELVQLQVGVADARGFFVTSLTADDFQVRVNGELRPAQIAYEIDLRRGRAADSAVAAAADRGENVRPVAARRHFLLMFDFSFTSRRGVLEARRAALRFVQEQVHPEDLLGVATTNRYGIFLLAPFTSDHRQALAAVETLGLRDASDMVGQGLDAEDSISEAIAELQAAAGGAGGLEALPAISFREYVANVSNFTDQLQDFGEMLQAIEGRKHVVFFSRGFEDVALTGVGLDALSAGAEARAVDPTAVASADPEMMYGAAEIRDSIDAAIEMFRSADAVIHAIDPSGLRSSSPGRQALVALADGTGGTMNWNTNDIGVALAEIEDATSQYYMIAYRKAPDDPPTVEVEVEVSRSGVRVVSAPTRLTPPPAYADMNETQRQLQLAEFFNDDVERSDIDFDSQVVTFPGSGSSGAAVILEVPGVELERLAAARGGGVIDLEIGLFAIDAKGAVRDTVRRGVRIDVAGMAERGPVYEQSFLFNDLLEVPAGSGSVKLLLREQQVGRMSSRTQRYWAPGSEPTMRVIRPLILVCSGDPAPPRDGEAFDPMMFGRERLLVRARPVLAPGEEFEVLVVAFHVPRHPVTGEVRAGIVLEAEDAEGEPYRLGDFDVIATRYDEGEDADATVAAGPHPGVAAGRYHPTLGSADGRRDRRPGRRANVGGHPLALSGRRPAGQGHEPSSGDPAGLRVHPALLRASRGRRGAGQSSVRRAPRERASGDLGGGEQRYQ